MLTETITNLILQGNTDQARAEIQADKEYSKITGKGRQLNSLQRRDLLQAINKAEIQANDSYWESHGEWVAEGGLH